MGRDLAESYACAREIYERADETLGYSISRLSFEGPQSELDRTVNTQPAILAASVAALAVVRQETGIVAPFALGHSLGEYSALVYAGALSFEDAVKVVHARGRFMEEAVPATEGSMCAVLGVDVSEVEDLCREAAGNDVLQPANINGADQIVVSGHRSALDRLAVAAERNGIAVRPLRVGGPFHCSLMGPAASRLAPLLEALRPEPPAVAVLSGVDTSCYEASTLVPKLVAQVTQPVLWADCARRLVDWGVRTVVELGPGTALNTLVRRIHKQMRTFPFGSTKDLAALRECATGDLAPFVRPLGHWRHSEDGTLVAQDGSELIWARTGRYERISPSLWQTAPNGVRVRKVGGGAVLYPDGKLSVLSPSEWAWRRDGSHVRRDGSGMLSPDGELQPLDPSLWVVAPDGVLRTRDGTRILWPDGREWSFHDPTAHGL